MPTFARVPRAPYADIEALPDTLVGEILDGVLDTQGRPAIRHALAASALIEELDPRSSAGAGVLVGGSSSSNPSSISDVIVPDLASWRRERMTERARRGRGHHRPVLDRRGARHEGDATVRAEPFDATELAPLVLWVE